MDVLWLASLTAALLIALAISGRMGWYLAQGILAEDAHLPHWLEALAPLKGRWLRLLLSAPAIGVLMLLVFLAVALPLSFASIFLSR
jgi:hypothetical protein